MRYLIPSLLLLIVVLCADCSKNNSAKGHLKSSMDFRNPDDVTAAGSFGVYQDRWAGPDVEIVLGNPAHEAALQIEGTNVQTNQPMETLPLLLLAGTDTIQSLTIGSVGDFKEAVVLPTWIRQRDTLEVRIVAGKSFVPSKLGTSNDDRTLSYRISSISMVPIGSVRQTLPSYFEFPATQESMLNASGVYPDGWMADSATFTLFNPESKMMVEVRGSVPGNVYTSVVSLDVMDDGKLLTRQQVGGNFRVQAQLPEQLRGQDRVVVTVRPSWAFVPADKGINTDTRRLSYRLQYVGLR